MHESWQADIPPKQVITRVRQGQKTLNDGRPMAEVIKELEIAEATRYR